MRDNNRVNSHTDRISASEIETFFSESKDVSKRALRREAKEKRKAEKSKKKSPFVIDVVEKKDIFDDLDALLDQNNDDSESEESRALDDILFANEVKATAEKMAEKESIVTGEGMVEEAISNEEESTDEETIAIEQLNKSES